MQQHATKTTEQAVHDRDVGMDRAASGAGTGWSEYATDFLREYLLTKPTMHVDDLWEAGLQSPPDSASKRALGAVINRAKKNGWVESQLHGGGIIAKPSNSSNRALKAVWISKLYQGSSN